MYHLKMIKFRVTGIWNTYLNKYLNKMKLGAVIASSDLNPMYSDFIPFFIKAWLTLFPEINVIVVLIADFIPEHLLEYEKYINLFKPLVNIHTAYQAQMIRLLYPRDINCNEGVLITDIDMIPMNKSYYVDSISNISDDAFVSYRDVLYPKQLAMCYIIASSNTWTSVIGNEPTEVLLKKYYNNKYDGIPGSIGWYSDQEILVNAYDIYKGEKIMLNDKFTGFNRLNRIEENSFNKYKLTNSILKKEYSDYHCLKPYTYYKIINDYILECLKQSVILS